MKDTEDFIADFRARVAGERRITKSPRKRVAKKRAKQKPTKERMRVGKRWLNLVSGQVYRWDGKLWRPTGEFPHGPDPMGFING